MELIRPGEKSAAVVDLQSRLEGIGFELEAAERGFFGPSTEGAVRALQRDRGLDVDGIVGENTWRELVESSWKLGDRLLQLSQPFSRGDDVAELQIRLNALGFDAGKQDGIFGPRTAHALTRFQTDLGIEPDGIAGHETVIALDRLRLVTKRGFGARTREREARRDVSRGIGGKRVVIDPGHGGTDPGGRGPSGESESEFAFRICASLARRLDAVGTSTLLTRGPYDGPDEITRAALANDFGADLLLSIHLNAHHDQLAAGASSYYFEGANIASEPGEHLAQLLQDELAAGGRIDCRAHGKSYPILRETSMPAVVLEPGFITDPDEVKALSDQAGVDDLVSQIVAALQRYFDEP